MSRITPEEQAAIDAFIAENGVTEVPAGVSAHKGYHWTGGKRGTHCGNCAVCWSTNSPIVFITH